MYTSVLQFVCISPAAPSLSSLVLACQLMAKPRLFCSTHIPLMALVIYHPLSKRSQLFMLAKQHPDPADTHCCHALACCVLQSDVRSSTPMWSVAHTCRLGMLAPTTTFKGDMLTDAVACHPRPTPPPVPDIQPPSAPLSPRIKAPLMPNTYGFAGKPRAPA
jgi:hypothetical protein